MILIKGIIFSVEEFSVYDGPGIRTAVFFKGCPLRCMWCHNPEGLSFQKQIIRNQNGCLHCGLCRELDGKLEDKTFTSEDLAVCQRSLVRVSGCEVTAKELAKDLFKNKDILDGAGGGITLTGGEVLSQPEFLISLLKELKGFHRAIETSGYGTNDVFAEAIKNCELVMMDIKLVDDSLHTHYTKRSNLVILSNLEILKNVDIPFVIRIPLIPGVNDTKENIEDTLRLITGVKALVGVELLPYNKMAGSKYSMLGQEYQIDFDPKKEVCIHKELFEKYSVKFKVL